MSRGNQISAGTKTVSDTSAGNAVALASVTSQCSYVIIEAPTAKETGGVNTDAIYCAVVSAPGDALTHANALLQGRYLSPSNHEGVRLMVSDAARVRLAGFAAGDFVRYRVIF